MDKYYFYIRFPEEISMDSGYTLHEWFEIKAVSEKEAREQLIAMLGKRKFEIIK